MSKRCGGFRATRTYTAVCAVGEFGDPVTVTKSFVSPASVEHAAQQALSLAKAEALARIVCLSHPPPVIYSSTQSAEFTATCPTGSEGDSVTRSASATVASLISQEDADTRATALAISRATSLAVGAISCVGIPMFTSTRSFTAFCPDGFSGSPNTAEVTRSSTVSQDDADSLALAAAEADAEGGLNCSQITYISTQSASASCPDGYEGDPASATATRTSTVSQEDADSQASAAAMLDAQNSLSCHQHVYTSSQTATVSCPAGTVGADSTATATGTSTNSQDDADTQAMNNAIALANAGLSCTNPVYTGNSSATVTCCDGSTQTASGTAEGSSQQEADNNAFGVAQSNAFANCPTCD